MDKGEFFKHEFEVLPAQDGGFIITLGLNYLRRIRGESRRDGAELGNIERWAFSNIDDLLKFLSDQVLREDASKNGEQS